MNLSVNNGSFANKRQETQSFTSFLLEAFDLILKKLIQLSDLFRTSANVSKELNKSNIITISDKKVSNLPKNSEISTLPSIKAEIHSMQIRLQSYMMNERSGNMNWEWSNGNTFEYEQYEIHLMKIQEQMRKEFNTVKARIGGLEEDTGQMLLLYKDILMDK